MGVGAPGGCARDVGLPHSNVSGVTVSGWSRPVRSCSKPDPQVLPVAINPLRCSAGHEGWRGGCSEP